MPFRELAKIGDDAFGIRPEIMRPIGMQQHSGGIVMVIGISRDVRAPVNYQAGCPALAGQALRENRAGAARANNQIVPS